MTLEELSQILRNCYEKARRNETILAIDLFGIEYGKIIRSNRINIRELVQASGIPVSYITEVTRGVKLSQYVLIQKGD